MLELFHSQVCGITVFCKNRFSRAPFEKNLGAPILRNLVLSKIGSFSLAEENQILRQD